MDINDIILDAEDGNVSAMMYLGNYYGRQEKYVDAEKWFEKAAEHGNVYAGYLSVFLKSISGRAMLHLEVKEALPYYASAYEWSCKSLEKKLNNHPDLTNIAIETIYNKHMETAYRYGYCLYMSGNYPEAFQVLNAIPADQMDPKVSLLYSILIFANRMYSDFSRAYDLLMNSMEEYETQKLDLDYYDSILVLIAIEYSKAWEEQDVFKAIDALSSRFAKENAVKAAHGLLNREEDNDAEIHAPINSGYIPSRIDDNPKVVKVDSPPTKKQIKRENDHTRERKEKMMEDKIVKLERMESEDRICKIRAFIFAGIAILVTLILSFPG